ncbi:12935_t:CDS:1, partial [Dentiscutata erythropus]
SSESKYEANTNINKLEYQEWFLALKECIMNLRECEAKIHLIELANIEKEKV